MLEQIHIFKIKQNIPNVNFELRNMIDKKSMIKFYKFRKNELLTQNIMSTKKKFDLTTIFVILVSIALILLGMYFLNQSFTKKTGIVKQDTTTSQKANVTISTASSSTAQTSFSSEINQSSSAGVSISSTNSSSASILISSATTSSSSSLKSNLPLSGSESKMKILKSLGGNSYEVEIVDSGIKDAKFWIKGKKLNINNNSSLKIDSEYRVGEITETPNSFNYGSIQE